MIALPFQCAYKAQKCYLAGQLCNLEAKYASIIVSHLHGFDRDVVIESTSFKESWALAVVRVNRSLCGDIWYKHCWCKNNLQQTNVLGTMCPLKSCFLHLDLNQTGPLDAALTSEHILRLILLKHLICNQCHTVKSQWYDNSGGCSNWCMGVEIGLISTITILRTDLEIIRTLCNLACRK